MLLFQEKYNCPAQVMNLFIQRFGGMTEDCQTALAIIAAESNFQRSSGATDFPVEDKSDNTKKSSTIIDKAKQNKVIYDQNRRQSSYEQEGGRLK